MAQISDDKMLAELSIPGTHDSGAMVDLSPGLSKAQDLTFAQQLAAGVRYFDVRCRDVQDQFLIYHGGVDQNQTYDQVLATFDSFLRAHPYEAVIVSVKEEATPSMISQSFEATFDAYVAQMPDRWVLAPTLPRLGDVRGKLVLLRRFTATTLPLGIDATQWPDNQTFTISDADAMLRIEDQYMVTANDMKWAAITALLGEAATSPATEMMLTYSSGYQTMNGLPNIPSVSDDINARLDTLLADPANANAHLGVLVMDFITATRAKAVIATN